MKVVAINFTTATFEDDIEVTLAVEECVAEKFPRAYFRRRLELGKEHSPWDYGYELLVYTFSNGRTFAAIGYSNREFPINTPVEIVSGLNVYSL